MASATRYTLGLHASATPLQGGLTQALADMPIESRRYEYIAYVVALAAVTVFAPCIPTSSLTVPDPVNHTDARVRAALTDRDLRNVMRVIRRGRVNSVYEIVRYQTRSPLLLVTEAPKSDLTSNTQLEVMLGETCGPLCGAGQTYYLEQVNGKWHVVSTSEWVS